MKTMLDLYERHALRYPEREIYVFGEQRRTYGAYVQRIRQLSSALHLAGLGHQDRVAIVAANSIEYFETYGACEAGSFIAAAFNFRLAPPELEYLIGHAQPRLLMFDAASAAAVDAVRGRISGIDHFVFIGENAPAWATPFESFLASGDPAGLAARPTADDYCNLFFTSGTTGRPKGVAYRHEDLLTIASRIAPEEEMRLLQVTPAFHVGGRCPSLGSIWNAGKTVLTGAFDPLGWLEVVQAEQINTTFMVPMMMQAVIDHPQFANYDLSSLQWIMAASTAIPPPLLIRAVEMIGPVFYIAYGSTECGSVARLRRTETRADGPPEMTERLASVGHIETAVDAVILDDHGNPVPRGEVGEVCVNSHCFNGYWNDPVATAEAMHGVYLRTGDMGRFDERDYLFLVDRKKDMIISGGENIYSREVEDALHRHPAIQTAAVIGIPDERWGESVFAVVVTRAGLQVTEAEVIAFCQTQLAKFKCPKSIAFAPELPMSGTGKVDKLILRARHGLLGKEAGGAAEGAHSQ